MVEETTLSPSKTMHRLKSKGVLVLLPLKLGAIYSISVWHVPCEGALLDHSRGSIAFGSVLQAGTLGAFGIGR